MPPSDYIRRLREKVGHELLMIPSVTAVIFDADRRVLLARHSEGGVWVAPGGSMEPQESPADAVVRETWEETGLRVEPVRLLGVFAGPEFEVRYGNGDAVTYVMLVFECRVTGGKPRADGTETLELGWFGEKELDQLNLPVWARVVLPKVFHAATAAAPGEDAPAAYFEKATQAPGA